MHKFNHNKWNGIKVRNKNNKRKSILISPPYIKKTKINYMKSINTSLIITKNKKLRIHRLTGFDISLY